MKLRDFLKMMRDLLDDTSFKDHCYLVGGVVRDHLLGKDDFYDFDLAVEQKFGGLKLGAYLDHRLNPISYEVFPRFGTARMDLGEIKLDFVETRRERYQPGKRFPRIRFGTIHDDVLRRDFSINSLYLELFSQKIIDPSGMGLRDLKDGIIRTLRPANKVLSEDYLRILRAIRFAACLDFRLHPEVEQAIIRYAPKLKRLSATAISREIRKMKDCGAWDAAGSLMQELGFDFALIEPDES